MAHLVRPWPRVGEITTGPVGFSSTFRVWLCRSHCPLAPADVGAHSTCMATIVQRVRGLGCWVAEVFPWSGRLLQCVGRQADVWTGSSVTWMLELSTHGMDGALRSSLTGCPSGTGHSWPWTPWCHPCMATALATALHDGTQPPRAGVAFAGSSQGEGNHIPPTQVREEGPVWWFWRLKWEVAGPRKQRIC